jgi:malonate transporter and related proteins
VRIADLILPVFAVILTGWIVGYTGYLSRALSGALIHFAYNIAMPALLIVTIAQEPAHSLINWRFLVAFGGGSLLCFILVFGVMSIRVSRTLASRTMYGMAASMTNTGFVALPVLAAIYGQRAVLPAAIATVFVAVVMFPIAVILLEVGQTDKNGSHTATMVTVKHVVLNPMVISTLIGMLLAVLNLRMPGRSPLILTSWPMRSPLVLSSPLDWGYPSMDCVPILCQLRCSRPSSSSSCL